jgi:O-antigen/teichoic acid export membrane protein
MLGLFFSLGTLVVVLAQGFLLTPVYLKHIEPALYGAWIAVGNILAWVELADPGVSALVQQRVATVLGKGDSKALGTAAGTGLALVLVFASLPLVALPLAPFVGGWVHLSQSHAELTKAFRLGVWALSLSLFAYGVGAVNIGLQRVVATGAITLFGSGLAIVVTLAALRRGAGVSSIPVGLIARFSLVLVANLVLLAVSRARKTLGPFALRKAEASHFAMLAGYTGIAKLGSVAVTRVDAFMTANIVNPAAATILTLTTRAYDIVRFGSDRVIGSSSAPLSHLAGEAGIEPARRVFDDIALLVSCASGLGIGAVLAFNRPFVGLWVGNDLFGGRLVTVAAGAGVFGAVMGGLTTQALFAVGGIRTGSWLPLAEAGLRIPLQYVLLRSLGIAGVPLASALTSGVMVAVAYPWAARIVMGHRGYRAVVIKAFGRASMLAAPGFILGVLLERSTVAWSWTVLFGAGGLYGVTMCTLLLVASPRVRFLAFAGRRRRENAMRAAHASDGSGGAEAGVGQ